MPGVIRGLHCSRLALLLLTLGIAAQIHFAEPSFLALLPGMVLWLLGQVSMVSSPVGGLWLCVGIFTSIGGIMSVLEAGGSERVQPFVVAILAFAASIGCTLLFTGSLANHIRRSGLNSASWALIALPFFSMLLAAAGFVPSFGALMLIFLVVYTVVLSDFLGRLANAVEKFQASFTPQTLS